MQSSEIRQAFLDYFKERGHLQVPSLPLVPAGDPTLLFTSAGMVQFKPYFMGLAEPPAKRLSSVQKVFRATDLDEVGDTSHLTFFEMMGNFSVGDYFKDEAIEWGWDFLTNVCKLDPEKLRITIYLDDEVAHDAWVRQGVPEERIYRYGEDQNYWFSGDVGPCGPDSEIFYDFGPQPDCDDCEPAHDGHRRFLEIWNLVFMMLYQHEDGSRTELPTKNIDTGSGLERMAAALNGNPDVYATELFQPQMAVLEELSGKRYGEEPRRDEAFRIVADHSRALAFLSSEGIPFSNLGRGYVLRRLLRRATYFGQRIGIKRTFVWKVAAAVIESMADLYPELARNQEETLNAIRDEEDRFSATLRRGADNLERLMATSRERSVSGKDVFRLYDTFGLPPELTQEIATTRGFAVDMDAFYAEMEVQRERGRSTHKFEERPLRERIPGVKSKFTGYDALEAETTVVATVPRHDPVNTAMREGTRGLIALAMTPFYPEGGGQVGDTGTITSSSGAVFQVEDTKDEGQGSIYHYGRLIAGTLRLDDKVRAVVNGERRAAIMRNHTATHLVHSALREVLGTHVRQTGSLVAPDRLRFDFSHNKPVTRDELREVERLVNAKIRQDVPVTTRHTTYQEAINEGVIAFFGDKYGSEVRVVEVPNGVAFSSAELCGGTHCHHTGQVGLFTIISEGSVGSGVRRIEALTGTAAEDLLASQRETLQELVQLAGGQQTEVVERVRSLASELEGLRKQLSRSQREQARESLTGLLDQATSVNGSRVLAARVDAGNAQALREMADSLREQIGSGIVVLGTVVDGKPAFLAMVTSDLTGRGIHAGNLVKQVAALTGGGGGGRPELAQAGGRDVSKLDEALELARNVACQSLEGG